MIATSNQLHELKSEIKSRERDVTILIDLLHKKWESEQKEDKNIIPCITAAVMLGLYNILEYLICECINYICDQINSNKITYFLIKPEIRRVLYKQAHKRGIEEMEALFHYEFCQFTPERDQLISGNIDYKQLNSVLRNFCIIDKNKKLPSNKSGINLDTLKDIRNNISHGNKGLSSVIYTYPDVEIFFHYMKELFIFIIDELELCINEERYYDDLCEATES